MGVEQFMKSRPTRACELKYIGGKLIIEEGASRPTRACELKFKKPIFFSKGKFVTPYTGV